MKTEMIKEMEKDMFAIMAAEGHMAIFNPDSEAFRLYEKIVNIENNI